MAQLPYQIEILDIPQKAPYGKLPFIRYKNETIPDSSNIIHRLKNESPSARNLTNLKQSEMHKAILIQRVFEEHLYFCMVHERWVIEDNWSHTKKEFFAHLPPGVNLVVPAIARNSVKNQLNSQGLGRHSSEEIYKRGVEDIDAIFGMAGKSGYILGGKKPSFVDATAFAMLAGIYYAHFASSPLKKEILSNKRCMNYLGHMQKNWASDLPPVGK